MPMPGGAEVVMVTLPALREGQRRYRYDLIRGDRIEAETTVSIDPSGDKTIFHIAVDDAFPREMAARIFAGIAEAIREMPC